MHGREAVGELYVTSVDVNSFSCLTSKTSRRHAVGDDDTMCQATFYFCIVDRLATEDGSTNRRRLGLLCLCANITIDDAQVLDGAKETGEESVVALSIGIALIDVEAIDHFPVTVELGLPFARCPFVSSFARCLIVLQQVVVHEQVVGEFEVDARPVVLGVIHRALQLSDGVNPVGFGYRAVAGAEEAGA